ncbi:MAG: hypothetical protein EAZ92_06620 [Candidatus Kapaibacterium sp.]|nr:MAG: hypothetical protein EAZ92_06620 [Candidatus Kapabacteria bacterium]
MAHASHADHTHHEHAAPSPIITGVAVVAALAMGWFLGILLPALTGAPRFAVGIAMGIVGILFGTTSNGANAFPGLQRFMEVFGISLFALGLVRYFNVAGILAKGEGMIAGLGKMLMLFM